MQFRPAIFMKPAALVAPAATITESLARVVPSELTSLTR